MHRMKIALAAAVALLVATLGIYATTTGAIRSAGEAEVASRLERSSKALGDVAVLRAAEFAGLAARRAKAASVVGVFDKADETARRQAAFAECQAINAGLRQEGRQAFIVAILDGEGKLVARDLNPNDMVGENLKAAYPAVAEALKGLPTSDVGKVKDRTTQIAVAPIQKPDGQVAGVLFIGGIFTVKLAQSTRDLTGADVAFFHSGKVQASSFASADGEREDTNRTQAVASLLFSGEKLADEALQKRGPSQVVRTSIDGSDFLAVAMPLGGNFSDKTTGGVLLASLSRATDEAKVVGTRILLLGFIGILIALGAAVLTAKRFITPLDKIELGVAEVINGKIDYLFEPVGPDFEGLSNGLNVVLARLLGRDDPNEDAVEEDDEDQRWKADEMAFDEGEGAMNEGSNLAQESDVAYYPRLYTEYLNALRAFAKPSVVISLPAFMAKLRLAEAGLKQKWSCRMVRFELVQRGGDLVFRALRVA